MNGIQTRAVKKGNEVIENETLFNAEYSRQQQCTCVYKQFSRIKDLSRVRNFFVQSVNIM